MGMQPSTGGQFTGKISLVLSTPPQQKWSSHHRTNITKPLDRTRVALKKHGMYSKQQQHKLFGSHSQIRSFPVKGKKEKCRQHSVYLLYKELADYSKTTTPRLVPACCIGACSPCSTLISNKPPSALSLKTQWNKTMTQFSPISTEEHQAMPSLFWAS